LPNFAEGARATWGQRREPRIFAYLRPFPGLPTLLQGLHGLPIQVLARIAEANQDGLAPFQRDGLVIVDRDIDLRAVAADCDAYINYGAHGTLAEMLLAGKPGLLIPTTLERSLVTRRAVSIGAALAAPATAGTNYEPALRRLFEDASLRKAAEAFARGHAVQVREEILPRWCEEFLALIS
jgi:UDP:flavonoid glycosyltransferase YjiC (YdhE family)